MLEIYLIILFVVSFLVILVNWIIVANSCCTGKSACILILPVTNETEDIELIVRKTVYKVAESYPEITVALINYNADNEKILIFKKLMENFCKYTIINSEKSSENICNIIENVIY